MIRPAWVNPTANNHRFFVFETAIVVWGFTYDAGHFVASVKILLERFFHCWSAAVESVFVSVGTATILEDFHGSFLVTVVICNHFVLLTLEERKSVFKITCSLIVICRLVQIISKLVSQIYLADYHILQRFSYVDSWVAEVGWSWLSCICVQQIAVLRQRNQAFTL